MIASIIDRKVVDVFESTIEELGQELLQFVDAERKQAKKRIVLLDFGRIENMSSTALGHFRIS
ncbi:MAG: hypothetical protein KGJ06_06695 [Pseudomonadota bacterium]|nr:hypothetical protein [Pseudomonadota bacterium]